MNTTLRITALTAAVAATLALAACDRRNSDSTAGQQVDRAVAKVENAGEQAKQATTEATAGMSAGAKDMAITTKINAALAGDDKLSAIRIDVDTKSGKVMLSGTAPDSTSRDRATTLASAVEGVSSVDNRLTLK
mgnify:CR=1 FL=1